ncbi:MAG: transglutaminase domain-containing protein, partial [Chloroflexota bacterium]
GVDWFLFDEKKGYADYSASAMAVLLRDVGVPARVVAGYSPGTFNTTDGTFHITEAQTATWTQVYFPGYGWIDFQPSGNSALAGRGSGTAGGGVSAQDSAAGQPDPSLPPVPPKPVLHQPAQTPRHFPWGIFWIVPAALLVLAFALSSRGSRITARLAYARLVLLGRLLGVRPLRWQTPREFGRELVRRRGLHLQHTETITSLYTAARYRSGPLPAADHRRAWRSWQVIRKQFALFWQRWL